MLYRRNSSKQQTLAVILHRDTLGDSIRFFWRLSYSLVPDYCTFFLQGVACLDSQRLEVSKAKQFSNTLT